MSPLAAPDPLPPEDEEPNVWTEIDKICAGPNESWDQVDDALRMWLDYSARLLGDSLLDHGDDIMAMCARRLIMSPLFDDSHHRGYVRTQIIYSLLQEDEPARIHAIASFLLLDGRGPEEVTFPHMIEASCFSRLVELIGITRDQSEAGTLHQLLLKLIYEMAGMERLRPQDLVQVDDSFIQGLFAAVESVSDDDDDPYHYPVIRVLLVLNEQYMLASTETAADPSSPADPPTNRVIKCLSLHGPSFRTFGENVILLLNRETETSLQLLILKLLYLLFTTKATYEYFYTNDLRVLLDVMIRNLTDLPDEKMSLRHTYLRVLYPLLAHTQLSRPPHYKRDEILRVLSILHGPNSAHFAPVDDTTVRLVHRVSKVPWLDEPETAAPTQDMSEGGIAHRLLGISLSSEHRGSSVSVEDIAAVMERPGIQTPSRHDGTRTPSGVDDAGDDEGILVGKKIPPVVPVPRRRRGVGGPSCSQAVMLHVDEDVKIPPKAPPPRRYGRRAVTPQDLTGGGE